jgi:Tfp pilus assembly protein PilN
MSTLTATRTATTARVNLLPPEIEEERRFRRVQLGLAGAVAASVAAVAVVFLLANGQVSDAEEELSVAQARTTQLESRAAEFSQVPIVYARVDAARAQLELAMGKEIRWSFFLNDLSLKTPNRVWLTSMTVASADPTTAVAAPAVAGGAQPYLTPGLGSVNFEGVALKHNDVAAWLDSLAKQKGYAQPYFTDSTKELIDTTEVVKFKSQVSITEDALSKRYVQKAGS